MSEITFCVYAGCETQGCVVCSEWPSNHNDHTWYVTTTPQVHPHFPHIPQTPPHSPHIPPCWFPTEGRQRGFLKSLASALGIQDSLVLRPALELCASSYCAASAPFQRLPCSHTGHRREHLKRFPLHKGSLMKGSASFSGTPLSSLHFFSRWRGKSDTLLSCWPSVEM